MPREPLMIAVLMLTALAVGLWAGWLIGRLRERDRHARHLRQAQRVVAAWGQLEPSASIWGCDADLRLTRFDAAVRNASGHDTNADSPAPVASPMPALGSPIVEHVATPTGPTLAEHLARRCVVLDLPVQMDGRPTRLSAVPLHDDAGAFCGWLGRLHEAGSRSATPTRIEAPPGTPSPSPGPSAADDALSFSYTVSHDLRAPLRVVEGFARILKEDHGTQLDRVGNDHLDRVLAAAARMNQMIDALLAMARLATQPLARQPVDLSQLAQFVVEDLRRGAPERRIEVHIDPGMTTQGDPTLLRQVVENLVGNAWKYTQRTAEPRLSFSRELSDGRPCYVVRDNGAGFDMRGADRLFGLFQRLHSASDFPGTGVGLASVKRIVARHGGRIWARSEPGKGASFSFTLWEQGGSQGS